LERRKNKELANTTIFWMKNMKESQPNSLENETIVEAFIVTKAASKQNKVYLLKLGLNYLR